MYVLCKVFGGKKETGDTFVDMYNLVDTIDLNDPLGEEELRILATIVEIIGQDGDQSAILEPLDAARILILTTLVELMVTGDDDGRHVPFDPLYVDEIPMMMRILVTLLIGGFGEDGVPPMDTEDIQNMTSIMVDQEMLNKTSTCSVCLDSLQARAEVNLLSCGHFFHVAFIRPWLGLHASCPVCRGVQEGDGEEEREEEAEEI